MSYSGSHFQWSAKAEPHSPFSIDDNWLLDDDLTFDNKDIFASLPLSLIQQDKHLHNHYEDGLYNDTRDQSQSPSAMDHYSYDNRIVPGVKQEEESDISPPYSPIQSQSEAQSPTKSRAELASKLLTELDECKEEPFSEWLEEKVDLPIFEDFSVPREPMQDTQSLLQEFESVCGAVGINQHHQLTHLTPPQSPPFHQPVQYTYQSDQVTYSNSDSSNSVVPLNNWQPDILDLEQPSQTELARELAVVEELVLRRAQDVTCCDRDIKPIHSPVSNESDSSVSDCVYYPPSFQFTKEEQNFGTHAAAPPPEHAYAKSIPDDNLQSGPFSPNSSSSCSLYGSSENEDEWAPSSSSSNASNSGRQKNYTRSKPYSRNPDDRRSRKKEQNKNAATRYRQKKKQEVEVLAGEEKELRDVHDDLQGKCSDLQREVKYLKGLMRDLCRAKGLIK